MGWYAERTDLIWRFRNWFQEMDNHCAHVITSKFPWHFFLHLSGQICGPFYTSEGIWAKYFHEAIDCSFLRHSVAAVFPQISWGNMSEGQQFCLKIIGRQYFALKDYLVLWRCCLRVEHLREKLSCKASTEMGSGLLRQEYMRCIKCIELYWVRDTSNL